VTGGEIESDWTAVFYGNSPLLLGNNGGSDRGGFSVYDLTDEALSEIASVYTGRAKLLTTVYGIDDKDYLITIAQPSSLLRAFELPSLQEAKSFSYKQLGDWSALCPWKSKTGNQYLYLFGKKQAVQYLVRSRDGNLELVQVGLLPME
jgi:3-phytase